MSANEPRKPTRQYPTVERPKTCGQWLLAFLLTGPIGIFVLAIWDFDVWTKFALVFWLVIGALVVFSLCL